MDINELKMIADGLKAIGKPGKDDRRAAAARLSLMERFTKLVQRATPAERSELAATLRSMLEDCR